MLRHQKALKLVQNTNRTCINKIYNNFSHIILLNFRNNKNPNAKNGTWKTIILVLKTVENYNCAV